MDNTNIIPTPLEHTQMDEILYGRSCTDFFDIPCEFRILITGVFTSSDVYTYPYNLYDPMDPSQRPSRLLSYPY